MDEMQMEQEGPGADEVIIELLQELVQQGRSKRAEAVMTPPVAAPPVGGDEAEMADLEQMLAEPAESPAVEAAEGEMCADCGKSPCAC